MKMKILETLSKEGYDKGIVNLVLLNLKKSNGDFFTAYELRLQLIKQIKTFNEIVERQVQNINNIQNNTS